MNIKHFFTRVLFVTLVCGGTVMIAQQVWARATVDPSTISYYRAIGYTCTAPVGLLNFVDCSRITYTNVISSYSATKNDYRTLTGYANYTTTATTEWAYFAVVYPYTPEAGSGH